jgi:hypothetical protein
MCLRHVGHRFPSTERYACTIRAPGHIVQAHWTYTRRCGREDPHYNVCLIALVFQPFQAAAERTGEREIDDPDSAAGQVRCASLTQP